MQDNGSPGQLQADGFSGISALAFDSNTNTLYGVAATADQLVIINTSTGQATGVGTPGLLSFGSVGGIAFDPESNILYGVDSSADMLLQINTSTGIGSGIGSPGSLSPFRNATGLAIKTPIIPPPGSTDYGWVKPHGGFWNANNWVEPGFPTGNDATATFGDVLTAPATIVADINVTVKRLSFDSPIPYNVSGQGNVSFEADAGDAALLVLQGAHQFQAVVDLVSNTDVEVAGGSSLTFNNALNLNGNTLTKTGAGTVAINNTLTLGGGMVSLLEGSLTGIGTIGGDVDNDGGTISPGTSLATNPIPEPSGIMLVALAVMSFWVAMGGRPKLCPAGRRAAIGDTFPGRAGPIGPS